MRWGPITLRSDLEDSKSASGIYLVDEQTGDESVLTLSDGLAAEVRVRQNQAFGTLQTSLDEVAWEKLRLLGDEELPSVVKELSTLGTSFTVPEPRLLVFHFSDERNEAKQKRRHISTKLFDHLCLEPQVSDRVQIMSSPFAASHTALFHGYLSTGVVSQIRQNLILIDARYLDGMEGGVITSERASVGLVLGPLIKSQGQGRLMAAVPWSVLKAYLPPRFNEALAQSSDRPNERERSWTGVVSVLIRSRQSISWGSGVLLDPDLVATNSHVVSNHEIEKIEVWAGETEVRSVKNIIKPRQGLDLVFLELERPILNMSSVNLADIDPTEGSFVRSVGFGLVLPHPRSKPLVSSGIVSRNVPGMLISSAGCWNGSSGGAVFNEHDELVGIMASNARDNITGEIIPDLSMSIPISIVKLAMDGAPIPDSVLNLWRLEPTYKEIVAKL